MYACTSSDCGTGPTPVGYTHLVSNATLGQTYTLGIAWDGTATLTLSVNGSATTVNVPAVSGLANVHAPGYDYKPIQTSINAGAAGGDGYVSGDFDNVYVNDALYDTFDGAPYSGPRLNPAKWSDLELVREIQNGKLVMKVAGTEAASRFASEILLANQELVTAASADVTVTAFESTNSEANARALNGAFYNDGSSTGLSDFTGTVAASIRIYSRNNGPLTLRFLVTRCADAPCNKEPVVVGDDFATVNLNETHTLFLLWDGSIFTYGVEDLGISKTFDSKPFAPVVKPAPNHSKLMRARVEFYQGGAAYGYIAATYDNVYVNSDAVTPSRLAPAYTGAITGDVVSAGVGLRGTGTGTINLTGIPAGATVQKAFLYWATLGSTGTYTAPTLNGAAVSGALIGQSDDPNWGTAQAFAYRADVTPLVSGNGSCTIAGLPLGPLPPASYAVNDSEGASLVVVYSEAGAPARVITINDGAVTLIGSRFQAYATALKGFVAANPPTGATLTFVMGDGQSATPKYSGLNTTLLASNEFSGGSGTYWDTRTYDASTALPAGATRADAIVTTGNDSLVWVAAILSVPGRLHTDAVGVFRPNDGTFYLDYNASGQWDGCGTDRCLQIGMLNDIPLVGDWNGNGTSKVGAFRPADGTFYLDYDGSGSWKGCGTDRYLQIGMSGDAPLLGKW